LNILDAIKTYKGNALRVINYGSPDSIRWLIWDNKNEQFVVYKSLNDNDLGFEIYRGNEESDAVLSLISGIRNTFINK
jgi:hypothetical protein